MPPAPGKPGHSLGIENMGVNGFDRLSETQERRRGLIGWPPYQADQKKTAKNIFTFLSSFFTTQQPLQAAA